MINPKKDSLYHEPEWKMFEKVPESEHQELEDLLNWAIANGYRELGFYITVDNFNHSYDLIGVSSINREGHFISSAMNHAKESV